MTRWLIALISFLAGSSAGAQSSRVTITHLPVPVNEPVYIAGSFNGWNPADEKYRFTSRDSLQEITLDLKPGVYEYKITRGSWNNVECGPKGETVSNRKLVIPDNNEIAIRVEQWADKVPAAPKVSTASRQVSVIDTAFYIPQLKRTRRVWIYLPADYKSTAKRYPVLYMHDGQNVFDALTSYSGEWGVDEYLDSTKNACIVVAIDHGGAKRINEYCPYNMERFGKGEGNAYIDFLAKTLKPFIDRNYRTLKAARYTFIAGSSMGGLISMSAVLRYPSVFGGAGVFSPAFWVGPRIFDDIKKSGRKFTGRIYFYAGKQESETMVPHTLRAFSAMSRVSRAQMTTVIRDEGQHNEPRWRAEFPAFYQWIMR